MKQRILLLIFSTLFLSGISFGQGVCGSYKGYLQDEIKKYPEFYKNLEQQNAELEKTNKDFLKNIVREKTTEGKRIIPVVVHVIYGSVNGGENISESAIQNALDALNKNINGQDDKFLEMYQGQFLKTPDIFAAVRGEANVEFRLAGLDPLGNSTDGIMRVQSDFSNGVEPRGLVKTLSYWNSYQYLNIWTVAGFTQSGLGGYAQFPGGGMSTDGIVLLSSSMTDPQSSTLTHEVGHWLGLRHIWGDAECGSDGIYDTPTHKFDNNGWSESSPTPQGHPKPTPALFPYHVGTVQPSWVPQGTPGGWGCVADSLNPSGEMFMNYMDYTNDNYCTMFSKGQVDVFNETLEGDTTQYGFRIHIWSDDNILATGTGDGYIPPICTKSANFTDGFGNEFSSICLGEDVWLKSNKGSAFGGNINSLTWDLGDNGTGTFNLGGPNDDNSLYEFTTPGSYNVSIIISYDETTEARAYDLSDLDLTNASSYDSIVSTLIVQGTMQELNNLGASNISLHIDEEGYSLDSYWKKNQSTVDSLVGAFNIDTNQIEIVEDTIVVYIDGGGNIPTPDSVLFNSVDSIWIYIDGNTLTSQDSVLLATPEYSADSSRIYTTEFYIGDRYTIFDYSFYFDTTILNILTYIDSTYLSAADSSLLNSADSSWSIDGFLNSSDSIRIYFAQFNSDTIITRTINIDTTALSASDSLMFKDADSTWIDQSFSGWVDTARTFYGSHYYTKYKGYYVDTLFHRGEIEEKIYVAYYTNTCADTTKKIDFITILPTTATNNASSYTYSFEDPSDLNGDWVVNATENQANIWNFTSFEDKSWEHASGVASHGSSCVKMAAKDGMLLKEYHIISAAYDLSGFTNPAIKFSWSGAAVNTYPVNELNVEYSDDCGDNWDPLGSLTNIEVANAGLYDSPFKPNANEWMDTVMTKTALKNDNIRFRFEYVTNGSSNNFYIDNIQLGEESALFQNTNENNARLAVYPNPTSGVTNILMENLADKDVQVKLMNILGADLKLLFDGTVISKYQTFDTDLSQFEDGIYFISVYSEGKAIITDKIILFK